MRGLYKEPISQYVSNTIFESSSVWLKHLQQWIRCCKYQNLLQETDCKTTFTHCFYSFPYASFIVLKYLQVGTIWEDLSSPILSPEESPVVIKRSSDHVSCFVWKFLLLKDDFISKVVLLLSVRHEILLNFQVPLTHFH